MARKETKTKRKIVYETSDGAVFDTEAKAKAHAVNRYGAQLSHIAHGLARTEGKYAKMQEYIDEHFDLFIDLKAVRDDIALVPDDLDDLDD